MKSRGFAMFRWLICLIGILTMSSLNAVVAQSSTVRLDGRVTVQPANVGARGASVTIVELFCYGMIVYFRPCLIRVLLQGGVEE